MHSNFKESYLCVFNLTGFEILWFRSGKIFQLEGVGLGDICHQRTNFAVFSCQKSHN